MSDRETKRNAMAQKLRNVGLRPTRQRLTLATLLFHGGHRHVTAELLHQEALNVSANVSLATVYNTLNQFMQAGLLRQGAVDAAYSYFDTNVGEHQHFYVEDERLLIDIPGKDIAISGVPDMPPGTTMARVDVVVRLKRG
jgi:Fur family iron response transcriptional regulator